MASIGERFTSAQERVKALGRRPSNEDLLELYALYKQGTEGDVSGSRPGMFDLKGRAKHDAWSGKKGLGKEKAQESYCALVDRLAG
jgi:diazepam-binding inhibitor (GABA receptor modulator, acyl-CoA-binding protein)